MTERETIKRWDSEQAVASLCSQLIRFPSENPPGNVLQIAAYIADYLKQGGITVRILEAAPGMVNVVGEMDFGPGPCLILNGHMDVVPVGDRNRWEFDPFSGEIAGEYILGRGASDMKGGLAALLVALRQAARWEGLHGRIVFMAVPDEETGGWMGTRWLLEQGYRGDACLIAEPTGVSPTIGQKGSLWIRAVTQGVPAHGSLSPLIGDNAILKMIHVIEAAYSLWEKTWDFPVDARALIQKSQTVLEQAGMMAQARALERVTVNVGRIQGGEKVNVVPGRCEAEFDLRVPIGVPVKVVQEELVRCIRNRVEEGVDLETPHMPVEANYTPPTHPFVQQVLEIISEVTGKAPIPLLQWATSDARFFRLHGIPTIQFGPAELEGIHGYNERVKVTQLARAVRVYMLLIHDYLSATEGGEKTSALDE